MVRPTSRPATSASARARPRTASRPSLDEPADFTGFPAAGLSFLREVAARQDRAWVAAHKAEYEAHVRAPMRALVVETMAACIDHGLPLVGDPVRSLFRLNRDTRFSADKSPFHTHASAVLTRTGEKRSPGVLYVQVVPRGSFAAVGFYQPDTAQLQRLRAAIVAAPTAWQRMVRALAESGLTLETSDAMVRGPRGYERAPASVQEALRLRSLIVVRPIAAAELRSPSLPATLADFAVAAAPLLRFGWRALEGETTTRPVRSR
ncbi:MAG: TIGR02453 family protein [Gemmatimonadaceae bacterium]|jgi:uncharacterized protein (TIGR02453 family)|nr:TIGR02453 family protein [Gemmatimonadaceae bacterium]